MLNQDSRQASSLRAEVRSELARISQLAETLLGRSPLLKGSLYRQRVHCGKPSCRKCRSGERHLRWRLSRQEQGKTVSYRVRKEEREALLGQIARWRECRKAVQELRAGLRRLIEAGKALVEVREVVPAKKGRKE